MLMPLHSTGDVAEEFKDRLVGSSTLLIGVGLMGVLLMLAAV